MIQGELLKNSANNRREDLKNSRNRTRRKNKINENTLTMNEFI